MRDQISYILECGARGKAGLNLVFCHQVQALWEIGRRKHFQTEIGARFQLRSNLVKGLLEGRCPVETDCVP